jgi:RNA polymerase sigma-70 factor (ECF subfamily)
MGPATISDLLAAVARRDIAAFRRLYDLTASRLVRVALAVTGDLALAEDAVQVAFVKVWERADRHDPAQGSAIGWMLRTCRNAAIDEARKERSARTHAERALGRPAFALGPEPDIGDYVSGLPVEQAQTLRSVYELGLTHSELAEQLKLPLGTVKSRVRRALISLREQVR